jgi:2-polyprenyl-3-methyl-5-hydroxy-6-metoxy-1,4-benzoquinol methylase
MDPMPVKEDIHLAYERYYTHTDAGESRPLAGENFVKRLYATVQRGYLALRYGYRAPVRTRLLGPLAYLLPLQRTNMDFSVMCLPRRSEGHLLEIGCGGGVMLQTMRDLGWSVRGLDFDPGAVANARRKGLTVDVGDVRDQGYPDESFDSIAMNHVIEHVYDLRSLLRECHRLLKPDGVLVMATPNPDGLGHRWFGRHWRGLEIPRHLGVYPAPTLATLATDSGFEAVRWKTTIRGAHWSLADSIRIRARAGRQEPRLNPAAVARALQLVEWIVLKFDRLAGDETAVIATKTARIHRREKLLPEGRTRAAPGSEAISTPVASRRPVDAL